MATARAGSTSICSIRASNTRGVPEAWPFGLDKSYNGIAWVGQHPKASTPLGHLCHTQCFWYIDLAINGVSIGEFGQLAMCAAELGVPAFFACGDQAFTEEAEALAPGIVTCAVKRGVTPARRGMHVQGVSRPQHERGICPASAPAQ